MKRLFGAVLLFLALLYCPHPAFGQMASVYISPSGAGSINGTSCANADAESFVNTAGNWGTGANQIGPGTTVNLCSGTYSTQLVCKGSGASGNPVTFQFLAGASFQAALWAAQSGAIYCANQGFINIIGQGSSTTTDIENLTNGDAGVTCPGGTCTTQSDSTGIMLSGAHDITIQNLNCSNLYVKTVANLVAGPDLSSKPGCIYWNASTGNITITHSIFHDQAWAINMSCGIGSNISIDHDQFYADDHGVFIGLNSCASATISNISIHDDWFHDFRNWDTTDDWWHHDGIHIADQTGAGPYTITGVSIYNNVYDGDWGGHITANLYCQSAQTSGGVLENVTVYNNVYAGTRQAVGNGSDNCQTNGTGIHFYDNVYIGLAGLSQDYCLSPQSASAAAVDVENNVFVNCPIPIHIDTNFEPTAGNWHHNIYENTTTYWQWGASNYTTFSGFQGACGCDATANGSSAQSTVDIYTTDQVTSPYVGQPQAGSVVLSAGANLTSLGITPLDSDTTLGNNRTAVARPSTGAWDIGAFLGSGSGGGGGTGPGSMPSSRRHPQLIVGAK